MLSLESQDLQAFFLFDTVRKIYSNLQTCNRNIRKIIIFLNIARLLRVSQDQTNFLISTHISLQTRTMNWHWANALLSTYGFLH